MKELHIKNMVCDRCIFVVREELMKLGLSHAEVGMGYVKLQNDIDVETKAVIAGKLGMHGFELLDTNKSRLVERMKNSIIRKIHHEEELDLKVNWSTYLAGELQQDYHSISALFSSVEGITLEQYIIRQKIERVKELLFYGELTLSEIAYKVGYSSVQHLSSQFKKVTGETPSQYKLSRQSKNPRKSLDSLS